MRRLFFITLGVVLLTGVLLIWFSSSTERSRVHAKAEKAVDGFYRCLNGYDGYEEAKELAENLCELGRENQDFDLEARGLVRLAFLEIYEGKWGNDWEEKLERAQGLLGSEDSVARSELLMFSGYMKGNWLGKIDEGIQELFDAISISQAHRNDKAFLLSNLYVAQLLLYKNQREEALRMGLKAVGVAEHVGHPELLQISLRTVIGIFLHCELESQAVDLAKRLKQVAPESSELAELVLFKTGDSSPMFAKLAASTKTLELKKDKSPVEWASLVDGLYLLAKAHHKKGQHAKAV